MNVNQSYPPFFGGISQEPSFEMKPGCLRDIVNAYPDITYGLRKRPGLRFQFTLDDSANLASCHWFTITQDNNFPVLGAIIPNNSIRLWNLTSSQELTYSGTPDYSYIQLNNVAGSTLNFNSYKTLVIQNTVLVLNKNVQVNQDTNLTTGTLTGTVTTYADLAALSPSNGDIYKITNTPNATEDDYYVKYVNSAWEETVAPGISKGIDSNTMPHVLSIDYANNTFQFLVGDNEERKVGDLVSNPDPSFVGAKINNLFFYLNRVGYLSKDNCFLSQPLRPDNTLQTAVRKTNHYNKSALVQSPADPVDVNAASLRPVTLSSVQPTYQGLILFSDREQFLLFSEQGAITPQTSIIKSIATYELNDFIDAVEMGDEYFFVSKTQRNTRVFKMVSRGLEQGPVLTDVGKIIADYIPNNITDLVTNSQNQFISLFSKSASKMYSYRVYRDEGEVLFKAWFTWQLPGNVQSTSFFDDRMFIVSEAGGKTSLLSASLNLVPEEDILTNVPFPDGLTGPGEGIGPFLDYWLSTATPQNFSVSYANQYIDSDGNSWGIDPIITMPTGYPAQLSNPLVVLTKDALSQDGSTSAAVGVGQTLPITQRNGQVWYLQGRINLGDSPAYVAGYQFSYDLTFPTTYFRNQQGYDYTAYLNIGRYKFAFREADEMQLIVKQYARETWTKIKPSTPAGFYV